LWPLNFFFVHSHSKMRRLWLVSQCERLKIHQYLTRCYPKIRGIWP